MEDEYQKFENGNEWKEDGCNCDGDCTCGCNDDDGHECNCEEQDYDCCCSKIEKLYIVSAIANIITAIVVIVIATLMFIQFKNPQTFNGGHAKVQKQQRELKPLFDKKGISLEEAMKQDKHIAVLFYADWCPHCQRFAPLFKKLSKNRDLNKKYNFVRINSEDPKARVVMEDYGVKGFPAFYLVNPKTGDKAFVENGFLFIDDAENGLKIMMNDFASRK